MKKVLLVIAFEGFQPDEYSQPKQLLEAAGVSVVTASDKMREAISKWERLKVKVDLILDNVNVFDYDGVFFVGGPGALEHLDNEKSYRVIKEIAASGKLWGAICLSPRILAHAGVLKNKKVTGWDNDNKLGEILADAGAEYVKKSVVVDGNLITANGPEAAQEFGEAIVELLK